MASLRLVEVLLLTTACVLVQAESNEITNPAPSSLLPELSQLESAGNEFTSTLIKYLAKTNRNVDESFKQIGQRLDTLYKRLDDIDHKLNQTQVDVNQIKKCQTCSHYDDCAEIYHKGNRTNGVYTIHPKGEAEVKVYCDMETDGGGWTVFQKRFNGEVDFYRGWEEYTDGFGDPESEYWLGLKYIRSLTHTQPNELYVGLTDFVVGAAFAKYGIFRISSEAREFQLTVGEYSGNASDSLAYNNGQKFSTNDNDNDRKSGDCSSERHGAWWYKQCSYSNLNGPFSVTTESSWASMNWYYLRNSKKSMKTTVMMMRPANFKP